MQVPRPETVHIGRWLASLEKQVEAGQLPITTKRTYEWGFAQFLDWFDHQPSNKVTAALIHRWIKSLQAQGHNSFSIGFWMDCVTSFFSWAYQAGEMPQNPTMGIFENGLSGRENRQIHIRPSRGALVVDELKPE
jgi:site-specific recombinase XerD